MIIKGAKLNLNLQWDIAPAVEIIIKTEPHYQKTDFTYEERDGVYRAETAEGMTDFFMWQGERNQGGCGGLEWDITMQDGSTRRVKGPWIGCSDQVNEIFSDRTEIIEVSYVDYLDEFRRHSGSMTVKKVCELLNMPEMGFNQFTIYTLELKKRECESKPELGYRAERISNAIKTIVETGSRWG